jgi:hypothetical protein
MDEQFPDVGGHLDRENPAVVVAEPPAHGFSIGNMKVGGSVILVENLVPAILDLDAMATKNWTEEASPLNVSDSAIPVVRTAQLVVVSRRVRQTVLRYSPPR